MTKDQKTIVAIIRKKHIREFATTTFNLVKTSTTFGNLTVTSSPNGSYIVTIA